MQNKIDFDINCWYSGGCPQETYNCKKTCHRFLEMSCLITNCGMSNVGKYLKMLTPAKVDIQAFVNLQQIKDNIVDFVDSGKNLFIAAMNLQTGKTTWSLKILYKYFDEIWCGNGFKVRGYFLHVPEFLNKLKDFNYKETSEYKQIDNYLKTCDLVIWDDITSQQLTPYEQNIINVYIDKRKMEDKSKLFTYSHATSIRSGMINAKFYIGNNSDFGTVATKNKSYIKFPLTDYESGLLNTNAGICYKDYNKEVSSDEIIQDRLRRMKLENRESSTHYAKTHQK